MPLLLPRLRGCSCLLGPAGLHLPFSWRSCSLAFDPEGSLGDRHRKARAWVRVNPCASLGSVLSCLHVPWCWDQQQQFSLGLSGCVPSARDIESNIHEPSSQSLRRLVS